MSTIGLESDPHEPSAADLVAALAGVRAFVLDVDGVLVLRGRPIPGALEAVVQLTERRVPFRVVTNYSSVHRETLAERFRAAGASIDAGLIVTAASAAAVHTAAAHPDEPIYVLGAPDALREFEGQHLLTPADAAAPGVTAGAVVIGDAGDGLSFANLDIAFRLIRGGAAFIAMHRNPWWLTPQGVTLDSGAAVAGLEYALGRRAIVLGKPSALPFRQALQALRADLGERRLPAGSVAMVGDDLLADLAPARRVGMRTVMVLSGKVDAAGIDQAIRNARFTPDLVAPSIAEVVAGLP
jgi:phospholysine phosphohistidine inorganic pyrophosphate phosphatase